MILFTQLDIASALETLCGQAFEAKKYHVLGIYKQWSGIVLLLCGVLVLPVYFYAGPILKLFGQPKNHAEQAGYLCLRFIPMHFSFVLLFPLQRFLQCQLENSINAITTAIVLGVHIYVSLFFVQRMKLGIIATALTLVFSWWLAVVGQFGYVVCGGCPAS